MTTFVNDLPERTVPHVIRVLGGRKRARLYSQVTLVIGNTEHLLNLVKRPANIGDGATQLLLQCTCGRACRVLRLLPSSQLGCYMCCRAASLRYRSQKGLSFQGENHDQINV